MALQNLLSTLAQKYPALEIILPSSKEAQSYLKERRGNFASTTVAIICPQTTEEISYIVKLCNEFSINIVPQGGNTGLTGGAVSFAESIIINLKNMDKVLNLNPNNFSVTVQSGIVLKQLHDYLKKLNLYFPLSLASETECTLGGNISTNAGGINVLKYGTTKDLILGLEVVLPNGEIISDLNILRKRNIGPNLNTIFSGAEGIMGIITAISLKVFPLNINSINILLGHNEINKLELLFNKLYNNYSSLVSSFEIFNKASLEIVKSYYPSIYFPIQDKNLWYCISKIDLPNIANTKNIFVEDIKLMLKKEDIDNYIISPEEKLWDVRYNIHNAQKFYGPSLKHDIGLPLDKISTFINTICPILEKTFPHTLKFITFGHMGDGNLHFNISSLNKEFNLQTLKTKIKEIVIKYVMELNGTFSAEHGIGLLYKTELKNYYNNQYNLIKLIKTTLDKKNILNPNKILDT